MSRLGRHLIQEENEGMVCGSCGNRSNDLRAGKAIIGPVKGHWWLYCTRCYRRFCEEVKKCP